MRMKKISAKDMREALKIVRETLGPDAMILTSQKTADGVEVMAAIDDFNKAQKFTEKVIQHSEPAPRKATTISDPALDALREELFALRHVVQEELGHFAFQDNSHKHPIQSMVYEKLIAMNFDKNLCEEFAFLIRERASLARALSECSDMIMHRLNRMIQPIPQKINCFLFTGLNGSGKTSSLAALALTYRLKDPSIKIKLVNFDLDKVAAHEPLQTYAKILNIEYVPCDDISDFKALLQNQDALTLVDMSLENANHVHNMIKNTHCLGVMVISAAMQYQKQKLLKPLFDSKFFSLGVITHVDEAVHFGNASSVLINQGLIPWFLLNNELNPQSKKTVFFDSKAWVEILFKESFEKISEIKIKGVA